MVKHGFPIGGLTFEWDDVVEYTPEQIRQVEQMLIQGWYDIDPDYFKEKYNIHIVGKRESALPEPAPDDDKTGRDDDDNDLTSDDKKQLRRLASIITGGDNSFFD